MIVLQNLRFFYWKIHNCSNQRFLYNLCFFVNERIDYLSIRWDSIKQELQAMKREASPLGMPNKMFKLPTVGNLSLVITSEEDRDKTFKSA